MMEREIVEDGVEQIVTILLCPHPKMNIMDATRYMVGSDRIIGNYEWQDQKVIFFKNGEIIEIPGSKKWEPSIEDILSGNYYIVK